MSKQLLNELTKKNVSAARKKVPAILINHNRAMSISSQRSSGMFSSHLMQANEESLRVNPKVQALIELRMNSQKRDAINQT